MMLGEEKAGSVRAFSNGRGKLKQVQQLFTLHLLSFISQPHLRFLVLPPLPLPRRKIWPQSSLNSPSSIHLPSRLVQVNPTIAPTGHDPRARTIALTLTPAPLPFALRAREVWGRHERASMIGVDDTEALGFGSRSKIGLAGAEGAA
jgi:hypothetical protein